MADIAAEGLQVIREIYPHKVEDQGRDEQVIEEPSFQLPCRLIYQSGNPGVVQAFDTVGLIDIAIRHKCTIELVPQVGDFVTKHDEVFRLYADDSSASAEELFEHIALERERTLEQDPAFAFRVIVDIACKALSPAINDPTTAVLALDQIHILLREVGRRRLDTGMVHDSSGNLRLVYRTPDWEDFVVLAVTEIRQFGANSTQVTRRMRAMLEDLIPLLPLHRALTLRQELTLLQSTIDHGFVVPLDRLRAELPDSQGLGGSQRYQQSEGRRIQPDSRVPNER
jgi:uncharacterized membrane protein